MRIIENVETKVIVKNTLGIVCNKCGKSSVPDYTNTVQEFKLAFGYGSKYDTHSMVFDLCEKCLEEIIEGFMINPDVF